MARYVKVSVVAPAPLELPAAWDHEMRLQAMMRHWEERIAPVLPERPDIIVLPEVCDRYGGYGADESSRGEYYRHRGNRMLDFFREMAEKQGCYIAYNAQIQVEDGFFRNATYLIGRSGEIEGVYYKNHLVVSECTLDGPFPGLCGKDTPIMALDFGKVACATCFDLNFDELRWKYMAKKPELMLFCSMYHGGFMQQAWAYDCRCWFVGAVAGQDCRIINPVGSVVASSTNYFPYVTATINLDYAVCHLDFNWDKFHAAKAKYGSKVGFFDPGQTGVALLTSETDEFTVWDIIREYDMELVDDYFDRSRRARNERIEETT